MFEAIYPTLASNIGLIGGEASEQSPRTGNRHGGLSICPYNVYRCADGYCAILANNAHQWEALVRYFGQDWAITDPRYESMYERVKHMDEVDAMVSEWVRDRPREEIFKGLVAVGVPCSPVRELPEVMADEHLHARKALVEVDHPVYGPLILPTSPIIYEEVPRDIRWPSRKLGEDQDSITRR